MMQKVEIKTLVHDRPVIGALKTSTDGENSITVKSFVLHKKHMKPLKYNGSDLNSSSQEVSCWYCDWILPFVHCT